MGTPPILPSQNAPQGTDAQAIMKAIQQMLAGVGAATGATGKEGGSPISTPGIPGQAPQPNISFNPQGAGTSLPHAPAPQRPGMPPTGSQSIGSFPTKGAATNAGLVSLGNSISGIFSSIEQKEHAKKATLAENYMMQINGLLASGDPKDKEKAMMILEDPKIRKILKTGLEYVPLEEEKPPEATGVQAAMQKTAQKMGGGGGGQPRQMQPIIPQASQQDQLKAAMTSAMLQKIKQDPAAAISMMGGSQLSSAEQHADEFYKAGLGISPKDMEKMTAAEKLGGLKIFESATAAAMRAEVDMYKAGVGYQGKVEAAKILGNARKYAADAAKSKTKDGKVNSYAAGAKIYEDYAKKYLDIIKGGKGPDGKPLTEDQIKQYQQKADSYQRQADQYLNQAGDQELMEEFQKALEEEPDASTSDEQPK